MKPAISVFLLTKAFDLLQTRIRRVYEFEG